MEAEADAVRREEVIGVEGVAMQTERRPQPVIVPDILIAVAVAADDAEVRCVTATRP